MKKISIPLVLIISFDSLMFVATAIFRILFELTGKGIFLTLFIVSLTVFYHFVMRILAASFVTLCLKNKGSFNYNDSWLKIKRLERKFFSIVNVKKWKGISITARPELFDIKTLTKESLAFNMAQAEIVHEVIIPLSFLPLFLSIQYGALPVFLLTSIAASLVDLKYVIIQRFNRERVLKSHLENRKQSGFL